MEDVSSATAPFWEPSKAPVLTSASLVQVQKSNQATKKHNDTAFSCHFLTSSFLRPNTAVLSGGEKKSPVAFDQTRKEEKQTSVQLPLSVGDCVSRAEES